MGNVFHFPAELEEAEGWTANRINYLSFLPEGYSISVNFFCSPIGHFIAWQYPAPASLDVRVL